MGVGMVLAPAACAVESEDANGVPSIQDVEGNDDSTGDGSTNDSLALPENLTIPIQMGAP